MLKQYSVLTCRMQALINGHAELQEAMKVVSTQAYMQHKEADKIFPLQTLRQVQDYIAADRPHYVRAVARVREVNFSRRQYSAHIVESLFSVDLILKELNWFSPHNKTSKFILPFDFCSAINNVARPKVTLFESYAVFENKIRKHFTSSLKKVRLAAACNWRVYSVV